MNSPFPSHSPEGRGDLQRLTAALGDAVAENPLLHRRVNSLRERLEHRWLQLAVLGQFKRGKSTFINALLGAPLLPIAVVPLTAVPVFISSRSPAYARVSFIDHRTDEELSTDDPSAIRQFLFRFISEEANPRNKLGIDRVDLLYPAPILADGLILIDTPGVGSTFHHNTEAALRVLPECDAAFFVISVDPPITEVEIEYLKQVKVKATKLFFVLNKIDYLRPEERDEVAEFVRRELEHHDLWCPDSMIFSVSATEGLEAKRRGDEARLASSGIANVEGYLSNELAAQKIRLVDQAVRGKATEIVSDAIAEVRLELRALEMPIEDLEEKCRAFRQTLASIEGQRRIVRDLLEGERRRLRTQLEERTEALRAEAITKLTAILDSKASGTEDLQGLSAATAELFDDARRELSPSFATAVSSTLNGHQKRIGELIADVRRTAGELFDTPFPTDFEPDRFALGEDPYWVTERLRTTLLPDVSGLVDRVVPDNVRLRRRRARVLHQLDELILRDAENLRWAILRGIDETFLRASRRFEEHLDGAIATTNGAVQDALDRRRTRKIAVGAELDRLQKRSTLLGDLQQTFRTKQGNHARSVEEVK